jgi:hypothetical protein
MIFHIDNFFLKLRNYYHRELSFVHEFLIMIYLKRNYSPYDMEDIIVKKQILDGKT